MKNEIYQFLREIKPNSDYGSILEEGKKVREYVDSKIDGHDYWQISDDEIISLYSIVKLLSPRIAIETGVGSGVSSETILKGIGNDGKLFSIDPFQPYGANGDKPVGFIVETELKGRWNLLKGKSVDILPRLLEEVNKLDLFMHDSDHTYENIMFELGSVWPCLRIGGVIVVDNFDWTPAPAEFCKEKQIKLTNIAGDMAAFIKTA